MGRTSATGSRRIFECRLGLVLATLAVSGVVRAEDMSPLQRMSDRLHLEAAQKPAAVRFLGAIATAAEQRMPGVSDEPTMTAPKRLEAVLSNMQQARARMEVWRTATQELYGELSPEQRAIWDRLDLQMYVGVEGVGVVADPAFAPDDYTPSKLALGESQPGWLVKPSEKVLTRLYPARAGPRGRADVKCIIDTSGYLSDCKVVFEAPKGQGFGNAALIATAYARFVPANSFGVPVQTQVTYPIAFGEEDGDLPLVFEAVKP